MNSNQRIELWPSHGLWSTRELNSILTAARWYASGDNCQPFRFRFLSTGFEIIYLREVGKHFLNPREIASLVSLGFLLEAIQAAAAVQGWRCLGRLTLNSFASGDAVEVIGIFNVTSATPQPRRLDPILARRTSRAHYDPNVMFKSDDVQTAIEATALGALKVQLIPQPSSKLLYAIACADSLLTDPRITWDLVRNTHLTERNPTGFLPENLNLRPHERALFKLAKFLGPRLGPYSFTGPGKLITVMKSYLSLRSAPYLLLISGRRPQTPNEWMEIGRCASRAWGRVGIEGFCAQPISSASLALRSLEAADQLSLVPPGMRQSMQNADLVIRQAFGVDANAVPLWLLRVGSDGQIQDKNRLRLEPENLQQA